jgi:phage gp36-like protein
VIPALIVARNVKEILQFVQNVHLLPQHEQEFRIVASVQMDCMIMVYLLNAINVTHNVQNAMEVQIIVLNAFLEGKIHLLAIVLMASIQILVYVLIVITIV